MNNSARLLFTAATLSFMAGTAASQTVGNPIGTIDTSISADGVVSLVGSSAVHPAILNAGFVSYTKIVAPNGQPIHLIGQNQVSAMQLARARRILEFYLTSSGSEFGFSDPTTNGSIKQTIANSLANSNGTLMYANDADQLDAIFNTPGFINLNLAMQDLGANESPVPGSSEWINNTNRDASYEEIFHLQHYHGLARVPETLAYHNDVIGAASNAAWGGSPNAGIFHVPQFLYTEWFDEGNSTHPTNPDPDGVPFGSVHQEYIISVIDSYYGQWAHEQTNDFYEPTTRAQVGSIDPLGLIAVEQYLPAILTYEEHIDPSFAGEFVIERDAALAYTHKSQYFQHVFLTGGLSSSLRGNALDNRLGGNSGDNTIRGGDGTDTVVFAGLQSEYLVTHNADGSVHVADSIAQRDGQDHLIDCEFALFTDGTIDLSATSGCSADFTQDGVLNFFDVSLFLQYFTSVDSRADLNNDGSLNFFDVSVFLSLFAAGCP